MSDFGSGRPRPQQRDRLRRTVGVVATVVLLGGAVAFFLATPRSGHQGATVAGSTPSAGSDGSTRGATASPTGSPSGTASGGATTAAADTGPGPGNGAPGIQLTASPQSDGSWDVVERVQLATAKTTLVLARPRIDRLGGDFADRTPTIDDLQVSADGQIAGLDRRGTGWLVQAATAGTGFELRYVLSGATVRSVPSTAGRALAVLAPLSQTGASADDVRVITIGSEVHSLQCPLLSGDGALCEAAPSGDRRSTRSLPRTEAMVLVQYDLPAPQ